MTPADLLAPTVTEWGSSRMSVRQRCLRENDLRYRLKLVPPPPKPNEAAREDYFEVGSLVHACQHAVNLQAIAGRLPHPGDWLPVLAESRRRREADPAAAIPWDKLDPIDEAERLVTAYYSHYGYANGGWPDSYRLEQAETLYQDLSLPASTRADLELSRNGLWIFADTKTKDKDLVSGKYSADRISQKLQTAAENYAVREQFLRTAWLIMQARGLDEPPQAVVDLIVKTKVPVFRRIPVAISRAAVDQWAANMAAIKMADEVLQCGPDPVLAPMNYDACVNPITQKRCAYFNHCHGLPGDRAAFKERN